MHTKITVDFDESDIGKGGIDGPVLQSVSRWI